MFHTIALQAARHKLCCVLGLLGATEATILQQHHQAIALQQRMWEVGSWRGLLVQAWQLHDAEELLAGELVQLQQLEQQQQQQGSCLQQPVEQDDAKQQQQHVSADVEQAVTCSDGRSSSKPQKRNTGAARQDHQQQQHTQHPAKQQYTAFCQGLADLVGWEGDAVVAAATSRCKEKVGQLLLAFAGRQCELGRLDRHVRRLAAVLMAGTGEALVQLQQHMEVQLQQVERSRQGIRQQLVEQKMLGEH